MVLFLKTKEMKLEMGKLYENKTLKYLVPALNYYGETLKTKLNMVFKLAFGVHDCLLNGSYLEGQRNIFILMDKGVRPDLYSNFICWIKLQDYYVTDYAFDTWESSRRQIVVLAFPFPLKYSYDNFLKGYYSKMYTKEQLNIYFATKEVSVSVLARTKTGKDSFITKVKKEFDVELKETDFTNAKFEYDLPPNKEEEYFNYKP